MRFQQDNGHDGSIYVFFDEDGQEHNVTFEAHVGTDKSHMYLTDCTVHETHRNTPALFVHKISYNDSHGVRVNDSFDLFHPPVYKPLEYLRTACTFCDVAIKTNGQGLVY